MGKSFWLFTGYWMDVPDPEDITKAELLVSTMKHSHKS